MAPKSSSLYRSLTVLFREVYIIACNSRYHMYSMWLFTYSDIKTIILPKTIFGTLNAIASPVFGLSRLPNVSWSDVLLRTPITITWVWINLLPFAIDNQRHESSVEEDKINKPWRVMPSGRMNQRQAKSFMLCGYGVAALVSWKVGGLPQCLILMALGFGYNDLGGSDRNCIVRNFINGLGYNCFASGATEVALGRSLLPFQPTLWSVLALQSPDLPNCFLFWKWITILVAVITTTAHAQDMQDQEGDSIHCRRTVPLSIGDFPARLSIVVGILFWSVVCCRFWAAGKLSCACVGGLAMTVSVRTCALRSIKADKLTFLLWNAWVTSLYALPLLKL